MNIYVLNNIGKKIYVRVLVKNSQTPGAIFDKVLELYKDRPRKTKETISILPIDSGDSDWLENLNPKEKIKMLNRLGWKIMIKKSTDHEKSILYELSPLN